MKINKNPEQMTTSQHHMNHVYATPNRIQSGGTLVNDDLCAYESRQYARSLRPKSRTTSSTAHAYSMVWFFSLSNFTILSINRKYLLKLYRKTVETKASIMKRNFQQEKWFTLQHISFLRHVHNSHIHSLFIIFFIDIKLFNKIWQIWNFLLISNY